MNDSGIREFFWRCRTFVAPLLLVIVIALVLDVLGYKHARTVSNIGTLIVMVANIIYVVAYHSRARWPGATWRQRFYNLFTFKRGR